MQDIDGAQESLGSYQAWCTRWKGFLAKTTRRPDGGWEYTHDRLVRARHSLNKLIAQGLLFTYLDPTWSQQMPAMTNQIESTNARLPQMLRTAPHAPDPTHESRVVVVLQPLSSP